MIEHQEIAESTSLTLDEKLRLKELLLQKAELVKENPLKYYAPHLKQSLFHSQGEVKHRAVFAGNRFGKSQMGVSEDGAFLVGERAWLPSGDPARIAGIPQRPVKLLVITTDWDKVDEIFTSERGEGGKLWRCLPRGIVKSKKRNHSGAIETMELTNGSLIRFDTVKSYEVNPQGSESSDWDAIHIDEPCSQDQYKAVSRGLMDRGGKDWFTLTPLKEPWIYDMFFSRENDDIKSLDTGLSHGNFWAIRGTTYDNPYLDPEDIKDYEDSLSEDEKTCRLHGIPLELSGMIYREFSYSRHVYKECPKDWKDLNLPPVNWPTIVSIDPHPQTPSMVLFSAIGPGETVYFYDELFERVTVEELAYNILSRTKDRHNVKFICDPWVFSEHALTGQCVARDLARLGVPVRKASKDLQGGILRVKQELKKENRLAFSCRLRETLYEFAHYVWAERENKPRDKDDHAMECLYRVLQENPRFFLPKYDRNMLIPELTMTVTPDTLLSL
jgi:hypothetical protein